MTIPETHTKREPQAFRPKLSIQAQKNTQITRRSQNKITRGDVIMAVIAVLVACISHP